MSSRAVNEAVVRVHVIAENEHRMEDTIATLSEDCVFEDVAMGRSYIGLDGARAYYKQWWNAFDIMVKGGKQHWSEDGNTMVAETRYTGLHVGEFCGISATGRAVTSDLPWSSRLEMARWRVSDSTMTRGRWPLNSA